MASTERVPVAIIGSCNIGTDLMIKVLRTSRTLQTPSWSSFADAAWSAARDMITDVALDLVPAPRRGFPRQVD